tara:strand:+ start:10723 stop:11157 length:435 start_codon:yes stop_codon:yes gene_type:complete
MNARDLPYQPMIKGALAMNGYTPEKALQETSWLRSSSPFTTSANNFERPFMLFDADGGSIDWGRSGVELRFRKSRGGYSFSMFIQTRAMPETILASMAGRTLDKIVDIPGAESMMIALVKEDEDGAGWTLGLQPTEAPKTELDI